MWVIDTCRLIQLARNVQMNRMELTAYFYQEMISKITSVGGAYLEPSLDYAELKSLGVYYGTPTSWINELREPNNCATPVAIKMARIVLTLTNTTWIHLVCNDSDRYRRLVNRGYTDKEIEARMTSGESVNSPPREAITFNTSEIRPDEIIRRIKERE